MLKAFQANQGVLPALLRRAPEYGAGRRQYGGEGADGAPRSRRGDRLGAAGYDAVLVNVVYGSLTTAIVVLLGLEVAATLLLLGAQVIAEKVSLREFHAIPPSPPHRYNARPCLRKC